MILDFDKNVRDFLTACSKYKVKMMMVGGGAVNFHGYQRHSADLDFWIRVDKENLDNLKLSLISLGFESFEFPENVKNEEQNISIKISPVTEIELITKFYPGKTFEEVYIRSIEKNIEGFSYRVIALEDLIETKKRSNRPKDILDIQELKRRHPDMS